MDNLKLGDKKYLDDAGLKALIEKIAGLNEATIKKITDVVADIAKVDEKQTNDIAANKAKNDEQDEKLTRIDQTAFVDVKLVQDKKNNKVNITFEPATETDVNGEKKKATKTVTIDTSAFVLDGMLGNVRLVVVSTKPDVLVSGEPAGAYEISSYNTDGAVYKKFCDLKDISDQNRIDGERFLVFEFNLTDHDGDLTEQAAGKKKDTVWINVRDLHDSYDFVAKVETKKDSTKYFNLEVKEINQAKGESVVTYTLTQTDKFIENMGLVQGEKDGGTGRGVHQIDKDLKATEELVTDIAKFAAFNPITTKSIGDYFDWKVFNGKGKEPEIIAKDPKTGKDVVPQP